MSLFGDLDDIFLPYYYKPASYAAIMMQSLQRNESQIWIEKEKQAKMNKLIDELLGIDNKNIGEK